MALRKRSRKSERKSNKTAKKRHVHRGGAMCPNCNGAGATFRQIPSSGCDGQGHFLEILTDFRGSLEKYGTIAKCVEGMERRLLNFPVTHAVEQGKSLIRRPRESVVTETFHLRN